MIIDERVVTEFLKSVAKNNVLLKDMMAKKDVKVVKRKTSLGCAEYNLLSKDNRAMIKIYITKKHIKLITSKNTKFDYSKEWLEFLKVQDADKTV